MAAPSSPQVPAIFSHVRRHVLCKAAAHDQTAQHVHRSRAEATKEDEGEAVRTVLDEIYAFVGTGAPQRGQGQTVKRGERLSQNFFRE